jgi:hypothetical protein
MVTHALGVVRADDCVRRRIAGTVSEMPDNVTGRINLDDAVVELIGDEDVARLVKSGTRDPGSAQDKADSDQK